MLLYAFSPNPFRANIEKYNNIKIEFNWFLFSERLYINGKYKIKITPNVIFFSPKTGKTFRLINDIYINENDINKTAKLKEPFIKELIFHIPKSKLDEINDFHKCPLVKYAKKYNSRLREVYSDFPGCKEIDNMFQQGNSCRYLTQYLI